VKINCEPFIESMKKVKENFNFEIVIKQQKKMLSSRPTLKTMELEQPLVKKMGEK
jgi:hypothetical protein